MSRTPFVVALSTVSSAKEGDRIARILVEEKLAACVNRVPGVRSTYRWKGKIETGREDLLVIKTSRAKLKAVIKRVRELHSYDVPEVIALPIEAGHEDYFQWLSESLK